MGRHILFSAAVACGLVSLAPLGALAGGPTEVAIDPLVVPAPPAPQPRSTLMFSLGAGASVGPSYFGSDDYSVSPRLPVQVTLLRFGGLEVGTEDPDAIETGFGMRGMFRYIPKRDAADYPELTGLNTVEATLILGAGIGYAGQNYDVFADVGYGVIGTNAFVGRLGADWVMRPSEMLTLRLGPRVFLMSDKFANTYFGVTAAESAASGLAEFDPEGGVMSAGLALGATYKLNDDWGIDGTLLWDRLLNDAAANPITAMGSEDQLTFQLALTKRFNLSF